MSYILALFPGLLIVFWLKKRNLIKISLKRQYNKLFILGALSVISAIFLENCGGEFLLEFYNENSLQYAFWDNFLVTAFSEELGKFVIMLGIIKIIQQEDETFGCLSGIFVGLGFGVIENIFYAIDEDITVMVLRAIFSVPGHALYGLYMGYFLWYAVKKKKLLYGTFLAFFLPVLQHGIYDFSLGLDNDLMILWTMIYNIILYAYAIRHISSLKTNVSTNTYASLEVLSASMP